MWAVGWAVSTVERLRPATGCRWERKGRPHSFRLKATTVKKGATPFGMRATPDGHARVRVLPGPQDDYFTDDALRVLQASPYTIGQNSDRMGFRLEGTRLSHSRGADIISDATPMGAVQVPASGLPILLMADRQTTGDIRRSRR